MAGSLKKVAPFLDPIGTALHGGKDKKSTPAPAPTDPAVMPESDDAAIMAAKRRAAIRQQARSGRASTVLSMADVSADKLGG